MPGTYQELIAYLFTDKRNLPKKCKKGRHEMSVEEIECLKNTRKATTCLLKRINEFI